MKADIQVLVAVTDGKKSGMTIVDAILAKDGSGRVMLVWKWGIKEGEEEEKPVEFTTVMTPQLVKRPDGRFLISGGPVFWGRLDEIGLLPPTQHP